MKSDAVALGVIGSLHAYLLWSAAGIAPFWIKRSPPASEIEISVRWTLPVVIILVLTFLYVRFTSPRINGFSRMLLRTAGIFGVTYFLTILLSAILDQLFIPDLTFLSMYTRNPTLLPIEFLLLSMIAIVISATVLALRGGISYFLSRLSLK